jgi:hypothetical protein
LVRATVHVEVRDLQGNVTRVDRTFATVPEGIFANGFEGGDLGAWSTSVP